MKNLIAILLLLFVTGSYAQTQLNISINNPIPRVGDEVELIFEYDFLSVELKKQVGSNVKIHNTGAHPGSINEGFSRTLIFDKEGEYTLGPFDLQVNNERYQTNAITVKVGEKLPFKAGVWIRYTENGDERLLIIEQQIGNQSDYKKTDNGFSYSKGGALEEGKKYVELDLESLKGIGSSSSSSRSFTRTNEGDDLFSPGLSYYIKKYKLDLEEDFKGSVKLKSKHFKNLPKDYVLEEIVIKK